MVACDINKNSFKYRTLKNMSGISEYSLDSFITTFQNKFGRMPELDELPKVNSEPYLKKVLKIKDYSAVSKLDTNTLLEYTNTSTVEDANILLNKQYKDLEIKLTPFLTFTSILTLHRPSLYQDMKEPIEIESNGVEGKSRILITSQLDKMRLLYGINIFPVESDEVLNLGVPNSSMVKGFIRDGNIYINTDNATLDTPVHELMHIFFGSIRYSNPNFYFSISNYVEQLPRYLELSKLFANRTRSDINEEIFVQEFSKYLVKLPSLFDNFDKATLSTIMYEVYRNIDTFIFGNYSVKSLTSNVFKNSIQDLLVKLQSDKGNNKQHGTLDDATLHRVLGNLKEDLIKQNKLEERCDG